MYTVNKLKKFKFFRNLFKEKDLSYILDPLTGLVNRTYMVAFVKSLIEDGARFSYGIIDLDNFKGINDTYGHSTGDEVLVNVSKTLIKFLKDYGVAGRFGGDEILFVNLKDFEYKDKKNWCDELYDTNSVLKKTYKLTGRDIYVTATLGMATYPDDAKGFDELFKLTDKLLYRGKSKGRNCYIIYVEKLHKDLEIKKLNSNNIFETMKNINNALAQGKTLKDKIRLGYEDIKNVIHITNMYYVGDQNILFSVIDNEPFVYMPDIEKISTKEVNPISSLAKVEKKYPDTTRIFHEMDHDTLLVTKIACEGKTYGHLVCTEPKIQRIWQDHDLAIMYYFGLMLGYEIRYKKVKNDLK